MRNISDIKAKSVTVTVFSPCLTSHACEKCLTAAYTRCKGVFRRPHFNPHRQYTTKFNIKLQLMMVLIDFIYLFFVYKMSETVQQNFADTNMTFNVV